MAVNWGAFQQPSFADTLRGVEADIQQNVRQQEAAADRQLQRQWAGEDRQIAREDRQQRISDRERQEAVAQFAAFRDLATGVQQAVAQGVPIDQAYDNLFQGYAPILDMTPEEAAETRNRAVNDPNFLRTLGQTAEQQLRFFQSRNGDIVGVTPQGRSELVYDAPEDPLDAEYRRAQIDAARARAGASQRSNRGGSGGGGRRTAQQMTDAELKAIAGAQ